MNAEPSDDPAPGRAPPLGQDMIDDRYKSLCAEIEERMHLTPPAIIYKLCKGEFLPPINGNAIFIEELIEIAQKLNSMRLVTIVKDDP
jgi:hypothetical protein